MKYLIPSYLICKAGTPKSLLEQCYNCCAKLFVPSMSPHASWISHFTARQTHTCIQWTVHQHYACTTSMEQSEAKGLPVWEQCKNDRDSILLLCFQHTPASIAPIFRNPPTIHSVPFWDIRVLDSNSKHSATQAIRHTVGAIQRSHYSICGSILPCKELGSDEHTSHAYEMLGQVSFSANDSKERSFLYLKRHHDSSLLHHVTPLICFPHVSHSLLLEPSPVYASWQFSTIRCAIVAESCW